MKYMLLLILSLGLLSAYGEQPDLLVQSEANTSLQEVNNRQSSLQLGGADLFAIACQACHSIAPGAPHRIGPNLGGIVGNAAASREGYVYSSALQQSELTWNKGNLMAWIISPESLAPGTWMLYENVLTGDEILRLIEYIEEIASVDRP